LRVSIIGTGYVGLITGVGLALRGQTVTCVDLDPVIVEKLNNGEPTIFEKGLEQALKEVLEAGRFQVTTNLAQAVAETELTIIAVGTPDSDGQIDLRYVQQAARDIGAVLRSKSNYHTVVVKSTVLPGTVDSVVLPLLEQASGKKLGEFGLGFNPEFLREASALEDFLYPDRIVLGADDPLSAAHLRELYDCWDVDFLEVNTRTAEMIKYANNCLLATQISVTNEIANLAAALGGIDAATVMQGVHLDHRWNPLNAEGQRVNPKILDFLFPGCGFGGSCFPKDVQALVAQGQSIGLPMHVLASVLRTNEEQPLEIVRLLSQGLGDLAGKRIAILGLSFKPESDDMRQSVSLPIIRALLGKGAQVSAADPVAHLRAREALGSLLIPLSADWRLAVRDVDAVALVTAWNEYRFLPAAELRRLMRGDLIVDGRGISSSLESSGLFRIIKIGFTPR
jgi:UDPglucose 6-dehydrogenase